MEQYEINDCGVCVNPKNAAEYGDTKCRYAVKVAFIGGRWHTGIDVALTTAGIGCPVSTAGDCYETEREAEIGCIRKAIADINRKLTEKEQLTLFDL